MVVASSDVAAATGFALGNYSIERSASQTRGRVTLRVKLRRPS